MSEGANGQGPAPADEFDRALRELTEGRANGARFHEPSAAERAKQAAVKARQARKEALRDAKQATKRARQQLRSGGGHRGLMTGTLIVLVVLVLAGGLTWIRLGRTAGGAADLRPAGKAPDGTRLVTGSAAGEIAAVSPEDPFNQPPDDPFYGSPAQGWANGTAGIITPKSRALGPFSAAQVAYAYATTRRLLIAAGLDQSTLSGAAPTAFADLLTGRQRTGFLYSLDAPGIGKDGTALSSRALVAAFAPGSSTLIGPVIKVSGAMHAIVVYNPGTPILAVSVDYRFVYPVKPPLQSMYWRRVIARFTGTVSFGHWAGKHTTLTPSVNWVQTDYGANCAVMDGYIHPAFGNTQADLIRQSGTPVDPYVAATSPLPHGGCEAATRV
jgi:hypothetical protein